MDFSFLFQKAPVMMHSHDASYRLISVNDKWLQVMGYRREEVLGRSSMDFLAPESRSLAAEKVLPGILETGMVADQPLRFITRTGRLLDTLYYAVAETDGEGRFLRTSAVIFDVTRMKMEEERLRGVQKMEAMRRLAGGVAHEFNNILTSILGFTALARPAVDPDDPVRSYLEEIHQAGTRAARLTRQLLAYDRKLVLAPVILDLNAFVSELSAPIRQTLGPRIRCEYRLDPDCGHVRIDKGMFRGILLDLVANAREAMPDGGALTVETACVELKEDFVLKNPESQPGVYAMLSLSDTGTVLEPEIQARYFDPFFSARSSVGMGAGLGMAAVYGMVKQSGGTLAVASDGEKGSTVRIYLPKVPEALGEG